MDIFDGPNQKVISKGYCKTSLQKSCLLFDWHFLYNSFFCATFLKESKRTPGFSPLHNQGCRWLQWRVPHVEPQQDFTSVTHVYRTDRSPLKEQNLSLLGHFGSSCLSTYNPERILQWMEICYGMCNGICSLVKWSNMKYKDWGKVLLIPKHKYQVSFLTRAIMSIFL